jgi:hypothetical protein
LPLHWCTLHYRFDCFPDLASDYSSFSLTLSSDEVSAVVLDVGTNLTKFGFAGDDSPKAVFPSVREIRLSFLFFALCLA